MAEKEKEKTVDLSTLVDASKAQRAKDAVEGKGKGGSSAVVLQQRYLAEGLKGDELVMAIYKGLGGLVDPAKAKKNRETEAKTRAKKASR